MQGTRTSSRGQPRRGAAPAAPPLFTKGEQRGAAQTCAAPLAAADSAAAGAAGLRSGGARSSRARLGSHWRGCPGRRQRRLLQRGCCSVPRGAPRSGCCAAGGGSGSAAAERCWAQCRARAPAAGGSPCQGCPSEESKGENVVLRRVDDCRDAVGAENGWEETAQGLLQPLPWVMGLLLSLRAALWPPLVAHWPPLM